MPWIVHDTKLPQIKYTVYDLLLFMIGFYQFIFSSWSIITVENLQDMCTLGISTSVLTTGIFITIFFLFYQDRMKELTDHWNSLNETILNSGSELNKSFLKNFLQVSFSNESFAQKILFIVFWTPIIYCFPVPVIDAIMHKYRTNLPLPVIYPYDDKRPGIYEVTIFLHTFSLVISVMKKLGNDCFFLSLFKIHIVYLRYLSSSIKRLGEEFKNADNNYIKNKLISHIKIHVEIVRNSHDLVSLYTPIIILYYVNLICIVVFGLFTQIKNDQDSSVQRISTFTFCMINIFQLYLQCSSAEEIGIEAEKVALEIYNIPWHKMNRQNSDMLRLMLLMAQRPIHVTAFRAPTFLLNRESFIKFVTNTITAFMTFSKMSDHEQ